VVRQRSKQLPQLFPSPSLSCSACPIKKDKTSGKNSEKMHSNMWVSKWLPRQTNRRHSHRCTTGTRWIAPIEDSKTSWATTKFADSFSPLHQGASNQKRIDRRKLGFQLVLEELYTPHSPLQRSSPTEIIVF
jgi:hypothetical protein